MSKEILVGSVDQTIDVFIQDSSSTVGAGLAALVFNSAGLACYYRKGATGAATALTLATQTVAGAHSDGGFVEIQATNFKGVYRLDLSDTMVAAAGMLTIMLYGATNMAPIVAEIEVVNVNKFNATTFGLTNLDVAVSTRLAPTTAGRTLDVSVGGEAGLDWANIGGPTTAQNLSATNIDVDQVVASVSGTVNAAVVSMAANSITAAVIATDAIDSDAIAASAAQEIADELSLRRGTAQAGAVGTITLDASASATTDLYKDCWCITIGGVGAGQSRLVTAYNGTTKVATIAPNWATAPDLTTVFRIVPAGKITGVVLADTLTTYTGNTVQTGDTYAVVNSGTHGNAALKTILQSSGVVVSASGITAASLAADCITAAKIATDAIGSDELAAAAVTKIWTTALTESYATDGAAFTPAQGLFMIWSYLAERGVSGVTMTCKKLDGTVTSMTFTLDSATVPTNLTRAT